MNKYVSIKAYGLVCMESQHTTWTVHVTLRTMLVSYKLVRRWGHEAKMHENENNVMRPRTRTRPTKRGREQERELKIWPRDHVGLENLTSLSLSHSYVSMCICHVDDRSINLGIPIMLINICKHVTQHNMTGLKLTHIMTLMKACGTG